MTKVQDGRPTYRGRTIPHHQFPPSPKKQRQPSPPTVSPPPSPPPSSHSPQRKSHPSPPDSPQPCFITPPPQLSNDIETESLQSKNKTRHRNVDDGLSKTSPSKSSKVVSHKKILRHLTKIKPSCVTVVLITCVSIFILYSYRQTVKVLQYFDQSEIMENKMSLPPMTNSSKHRNRIDEESSFRNKPRIVYYSGKPYILPAKTSLPSQIIPTSTSSPPPPPPLVNQTCTPPLPFHPTCNLLHELPLHNLTILSTTGSWRLVFSLSSHAALKILRLDRPFDPDTYTRHSIDSFAMDALSSSPAIVTEYSFCGQSVVTEVATSEGWRRFVKGESRGCERLRVGWELAKGMRGMHEGIMKSVTLVHNDVNAANVVDVGGRIKFNDFNIGVLMKRGCDFVAAFDGVYWRSPEEIMNQTGVTEKIDVYSLGNLFFQLLTTHEPWKWLEPGSRPPATLVEEKKRRGELPYIPEKYAGIKDVCLRALHLATVACYEFDAKKRLSAAALAKRMGFVVKAVEKGEGQRLTEGRLTKLFKGV